MGGGESITEKKIDWARKQYDVKKTPQEQKSTNESLPRKDAKLPAKEEFQKALSSALKDETFRQVLDNDPMKAMKLLYDKSFPDYKLSENITVKVLQDRSDLHHFVLPKPADHSEVPRELELSKHGYTDGCPSVPPNCGDTNYCNTSPGRC